MFYAAAKAVAQSTSEAELRKGSVLPSMDRIREVTDAVAARVAEEAVVSMVASSTPKGTLSCLQEAQLRSKDEGSGDGLGQSQLAAEESCIKGLQYDPFALASK